MIYEYIITVCGIGSAAFLGYIAWKNRPAAVGGPAPGLSRDVIAKYAQLDRMIRRIVLALAITLGLTGFVSIPLGNAGFRDGLVMLHTIMGACFILALLPLLLLRAGSMGRRALELINDHDTPATKSPSGFGAHLSTATFWIMAVLAIGLLATIWGMFSASVSQTEQIILRQLHALFSILFLIALGAFTRQIVKASRI